MTPLFTDKNWSVVKAFFYYDEMNIGVRHDCQVYVPTSTVEAVQLGQYCRYCGEDMPDSIKTLIVLNNDNIQETHRFLRINYDPSIRRR